MASRFDYRESFQLFAVEFGTEIRYRLIPLSISRLLDLATTLSAPDFLFRYSTTEIYTQALMCFSLISATIPCLRIFLGAFQSGMLGGDLIITTSSGMGTISSGAKSKSHKESGNLRNSKLSFVHERTCIEYNPSLNHAETV